MCIIYCMWCVLYYQPRGNSSLCIEHIPECWKDGHHMDIKCYSACCQHHHHVAATCLKQAWCIYFRGEGFVLSKVCVCVYVLLLFLKKKKLILCHVLKEPLFLIQSRTLLKAILNVSMGLVKFSILPSFSNWILWVYLRLCFSVTAICVYTGGMHTQVLNYKYTASTVFTGFVYTGRKKVIIFVYWYYCCIMYTKQGH